MGRGPMGDSCHWRWCPAIVVLGMGVGCGMEWVVAKLSHDKHCGLCFVLHWLGLPLTGSPLACLSLPPQTPPLSDNEPPTSLKRGGWVWVEAMFLRSLVALVIGPTSLIRGEGHLVHGIPLLWVSWVARVVVEGGKMNPTSTASMVDV